MSSVEVHRQHYNVTFTLLAAAAVSYALLQSLVAPALLTIQHDLDTSTTGAAWILSAYLLSASVVTPIAGRLGDMYGKKAVMVAVLVILAAGTALAGVATSIGVMIVARVIQGAGGAIFPLAFGIIRDEFPPERVPHGIALISAILGIGGGLGIVLAGPILAHFSYHWLFWFPLIAVVIALVGILFFVPESPVRARGRIDPVGAILLGGWLVALLVAISEGSVWGWTSGKTLTLFAATAVLIPVWIWWEWRSHSPVVDMQMMRLRGVWTTNLAALLFGFGMYSSFILVPQFVEQSKSAGFGFAASVTQAGLFLVPATLGMLVAGPISGRLSSTVGSKVPLLVGSLVSAEQTGVATGMNTIVRTIGGAIGSTVAAEIVAATATNGEATERGFTIAFAASAVALVVAFLAGLAVPARRARTPEPETPRRKIAPVRQGEAR
jgi:MFS family permease